MRHRASDGRRRRRARTEGAARSAAARGEVVVATGARRVVVAAHLLEQRATHHHVCADGEAVRDSRALVEEEIDVEQRPQGHAPRQLAGDMPRDEVGALERGQPAFEPVRRGTQSPSVNASTGARAAAAPVFPAAYWFRGGCRKVRRRSFVSTASIAPSVEPSSTTRTSNSSGRASDARVLRADAAAAVPGCARGRRRSRGASTPLRRRPALPELPPGGSFT